jgi:ribosomal subunit interface protein
VDIIVKGRHTGINDRFRELANVKLAKIGKLDHKVIRVDVEVSQERNPRITDQRERVELTIHSRGPVIRAEAAADDRFAALDQAVSKLESRLRRVCERRKDARRGKGAAGAAGAPPTAFEPVGAPTLGEEPVGPATTLVETRVVPEPARSPESEGEGPIVAIEMDGDGPLVVREKMHRSEPMTIDQALFEMELVGHDFFLFRDKEGGQPSVVYRRRGYDYGVIRLEEE